MRESPLWRQGTRSANVAFGQISAEKSGDSFVEDSPQHVRRHRDQVFPGPHPVGAINRNRNADGPGRGGKDQHAAIGMGDFFGFDPQSQLFDKPALVRSRSRNAWLPTTRRGRLSVTPRTMEPPPSFASAGTVLNQPLEMEVGFCLLEFQVLPFLGCQPLLKLLGVYGHAASCVWASKVPGHN